MKNSNLRLIFYVSIAWALLATSMTQAADTAGKYAVRGVGASKCSALVSYIDSKDQAVQKEALSLYVSWIDGYLSNVNRSEKNTYEASPFMQGADFLAILSGQCRKNPDALVETLTFQVISALDKVKIQNESPVIEIKVGEKKGNFRKDIVVLMQKKMIDMKLLQGKADGDFGQSSQNALKSFQKTAKLPETGFPDVDTVLQLTLK